MGLRAWWRSRRAGGAGGDTADRGRRAGGAGGDAAGWNAAADTAAFSVTRGADEATVMVGAGPHEATVMVGAGPHSEPPPGPATEVLPRTDATANAAGAAGPAAGLAPGLAPTRALTLPHVARPRVAGVLVVVEGEFEGRAFPLFEGTNRIGREHICEICLPSERLAPLHVCIECRAGSFRIERIAEPELRVNLEPVARSLLRDGDAIQIGMTTFRFRSIVGA